MPIVKKTVKAFVHAPLQSTFEYVSDLRRHPEWNDGLRVEEVTPGPIAVGKEYISHGEVLVQKNRQNSVRVTHYEPPNKFGFSADDPDFGKATHLFTFSAQNGGVLVIRTMILDLNPILAFVFSNFIYPLIGGPAMKQSMTALKMKLEEKVEVTSPDKL